MDKKDFLKALEEMLSHCQDKRQSDYERRAFGLFQRYSDE